MTRKIEVDPIVEALESMPYGLYIIGSHGSDNINGMMADWATQVSFNPRLVAVALERNSTTLRNLRESGFFTINILAAEQRALAVKFCQPRQASKVVGRSEDASAVVYDKMDGVPYQMGALTDCPILDAGLAYLECQVDQLVDVGDHTLAVGRVLDGAVLREGEPLTQRILGWSYAG
ncbi:MAG TPA: flavin reductase family protein [Dehalococcoidia bacterium]|nr:flavin reductase family protein [Dehalococcoidia bacterium]